MANKREFKKYLCQVSENLMGEMTFAASVTEGADIALVDDAAIDVLKACSNALMHCNVKFDKTAGAFENEREYRKQRNIFYNEMYAKINREFVDAIDAAVKKFNSAMPHSK